MRVRSKWIGLGVGLSAAVLLIVALVLLFTLKGSSTTPVTIAPTATCVPPFPANEWVGLPNFVQTTNTIVGTSVGPCYGGTWNDETGSGVCYESSDKNMNTMLIVLKDDGTTIERVGVNDYNISTNPNGTFCQATSGVSVAADVALVAHGNPTWPEGSLTSHYMLFNRPEHSWVLGQTKDLTVGAGQLVMTIAYPNLTRSYYSCAQPPTVSAPTTHTVTARKIHDNGQMVDAPNLEVPQSATVLGLAGNQDWFAVYTVNIVYLYQAQANGTYNTTHTQTIDVTDNVTTSTTQPYNLVGMSVDYVAYADAFNLNIVPVTPGSGVSTGRTQVIPLSTGLGLRSVEGVQMEADLLLVHGKDRTVLLTVADVVSDGTYYGVAGLQSFDVTGKYRVRLPCAYSRKRGVGHLMMPEKGVAPVWRQWTWVLGSKK